MEVVNCPRCGRIFTKIKENICADCLKKQEETFDKLKKYIDDNPHSSLQEISDATEVSPNKILHYIREGRLELSKGMHGALRCEICGKPVRRGRYCDTCIIHVNQDVNRLFSESQREKNKVVRMHTAGSKKL